MKNNLRILLISLFALAIYSCKKDEVQSTTTPARINSMSAFNDAHKKPTQHFTLNASSGGSITTTGGLEFFFPSNAFANSTGTIVTGNVEVQIDEVISIADLFLNQISTHSDGRPLKSGGAFNIKVTQGAEKLKAATGKQYHVWLTSNSIEQTPVMETYYGIPTNDQFGKINWTTTPPGFAPNVFSNTTDSTNIYEMVLDKFDWINCDHPYDSVFTQLEITLPAGSEHCQIMVLDNSTMTGINLWNNENTVTWNYAPLNRQLTAVVVNYSNEVYKVSAQTFYFTGQQITMPMMTTISEADLENYINSF